MKLRQETLDVARDDGEFNGLLSRRLFLGASIGVAQTIGAACRAEPSSAFPRLEEEVRRQMSAQDIPGLAMAVVHRGRVALTSGFGVADVDDRRPVRSDTAFRIGSVTKPLTALALLRLADAGLLDLDAPARAYAPEFRVNDAITVRHLLSHSSGLGDMLAARRNSGPEALSRYVSSFESDGLVFRPGAVLHYSNPGFVVAGLIAEHVSGLPYDAVMGEMFRSLELSRTTLNTTEARATGAVATGHWRLNDRARPAPLSEGQWHNHPAGYAFSTAEDLARLALMLMRDPQHGPLLSPRHYGEMTRPVKFIPPALTGYGLGLAIDHQRGPDCVTIGHSGVLGGYRAALQVVPQRGFAVALLTNSATARLDEIIDAAFAEAGLPGPLSSEPPGRSDPQHRGAFWTAGLIGARVRLTVEPEAEGLQLVYGNERRRRFRFVRPDFFMAEDRDQGAAFLRDPGGRVTGLQLGLRHWAKLAD